MAAQGEPASCLSCEDRESGQTALRGLAGRRVPTGLEPFRRTARTLRKWQKEVLNYWRYPLTNAIVESKHNRVKVLRRRAYGYRNDQVFSLRILNLFHT
jgi:transposase